MANVSVHPPTHSAYSDPRSFHLFLSLFLSASLYLCLFISVYLSVSLSVSVFLLLSICLCLSVSAIVCPHFSSVHLSCSMSQPSACLLQFVYRDTVEKHALNTGK